MLFAKMFAYAPLESGFSKIRFVKAIVRLLFVLLLPICTPAAHAQESEDDPVELEEIVVEEEGEPESRLPLGIGISGETLRTMPGSAGDPIRGMQVLPGLSYANDEDAVPAVRGSRPGDNYFEADFAPVNYLFHLGGALSIFNADLIKSFDVYQSGYGPEFSGVTGGVFDIQLRDPKADRLRGSLDISLLHAGLLVEGPVSDNQSFYLAGRFSYLDLFLADQLPEEDGFRIDKFPEYKDYQGKYVWNLDEENKVTLQFNGANDLSQINIDDDSEEIDTDPAVAGLFKQDTVFHEQAVVWDSNVNDKLTIKALLSHNYAVDSNKLGGIGDIDVKTDRFMLKSEASYVLNDNHELIVGGQLARYAVDLDLELSIPTCGELDVDCLITGAESRSTDRSFNVNAARAYVKDNWYLTDKLTLFPGLAFQAEDYLDEQHVEPRLALEYSISNSTILSAGFGQYNQAPGSIESDEVFGNPNLKYTESLHSQVGIDKTFSSGWKVRSELYYKTMDNLVTSDDEDNYTSDASGFAYGLDTLVQKDFSSKLSGWAALSFSKARRKDDRTGETFVFDYDQPVNLSLVGDYKFNQKWSLGAKLWVHSGAPFTPVISATEDPDRPGFFIPTYGKLNSDRFPTYQRLDLRINRNFKRKKDNTMSLYFELINVLQKENAAEYDYNADYSEREIVSQLSGIFSFGFKATF